LTAPKLSKLEVLLAICEIWTQNSSIIVLAKSNKNIQDKIDDSEQATILTAPYGNMQNKI